MTELEDFFTHPQGRPEEGYERSRSPSLSSVDSFPRPHSPVTGDYNRGLHNGHLSDNSDDNLPENIYNGYEDTHHGKVNSNGLPEHASMPNFFMPMQNLEESMKALQMATSAFPSSSHNGDQVSLCYNIYF